MGRALRADEFSKYASLLEPEPIIRLQMSLFEERFRDNFDCEVDKIVKAKLPEAIKEELALKLEEIADEIDQLEETLLALLRHASYNNLPDTLRECFETFASKNNLHGD